VPRNENPNSAFPPAPVPQGPENGWMLAPYDPGFAPGPAEEEIDLRAMWQTIVRYRTTILAVAGVVLASTIAATLLMRPVFRGTALVEIRPGGQTVVRMNTIEHAFDARHVEYLETQWRIIRSESVAESVLDRLDLRGDPELTGATRQRGFLSGLGELLGALFAEAKPPSVAAGPLEPDAEPLETFLERVDVSPVRDSNLVEVSFDSFDPKRSAEVANAVVEQYVRLSDLRRIHSASGAREFLEQEIAKAEERLQESERELNGFARAHNIVDVDEGADLVETHVAQLSHDLTETVGERITAEALYRQVQSGHAANIPALAENDLISKLQETRAQLSAEHVRLSRIYKDSYPKVSQLRAQIRDVDASLAAEQHRVAAKITADFEKARRKEELVRVELDEQKDALLDLKDRAVQYHILKRDWLTNRELHAGLLERMKEVGVAVGMEVSNVSVIDRARVPVEPHRPRLVVNTSAALAAGLALGIALAFLLAYLDDVVRTPEDFESLTGLASLGLVPKLDEPDLAPCDRLEILSHTRRQSSIAEALRSVRTNLLGSSLSSTARVLQVTSAFEGEGKTTTAGNLAVVLAQRGSRVLLVDADLRRPRLHQIFGVEQNPGLRDILAGGHPEAIAKTEIENLWVLPAGDPPNDPAELLASMNMEVLIEQVREAFDFVVIDSPPILGLADSAVVGTKVDGVIVVVSAEGARKGAVREAVKRLRLVRAPLLGGVLNMADERRCAYGTYGYYGYKRGAAQQRAEPAAS